MSGRQVCPVGRWTWPLLGAATALLFVPLSDGASIYVPSTYGTVQAAINAAAPGDVIHLSAGVYREVLAINKSLTICGSGTNNCAIYSCTNVPIVTVLGPAVVTLSNFEIEGGDYISPSIGYSGVSTHGIVSTNADLVLDTIVMNQFYNYYVTFVNGHLTVTNVALATRNIAMQCDIGFQLKGCTGTLIRLVQDSCYLDHTINVNDTPAGYSDLVVNGCRIRASHLNWGNCIRTYANSKLVVTNCFFYRGPNEDVPGSFFYHNAFSANGLSNRVLITGNTISNLPWGVYCYDGSPTDNGGNRIRIEHNVIKNSQFGGIVVHNYPREGVDLGGGNLGSKGGNVFSHTSPPPGYCDVIVTNSSADVFAEGNTWTGGTGTNIEKYIFDKLDDSRWGKVITAPVHLSVTSAYGCSLPAVGTSAYSNGTSLTASITNSVVTRGATQYVCRGWVGSGSLPASGNTTNTGAFVLTGNSSIVWLWCTNYWLDLRTGGGGNLARSASWCSSGASLLITATPSNHNHFASWSGDTNGCSISSNRITAAMTRPRTITANFAIDRQTLVVRSNHGGASPPAGTNAYNYGTSVRASITNSPVTSGATQYVCNGWTGTGSVPTTGVTTNTGIFVLATNSTIAWTWRTNYLLSPRVSAGGQVNITARWCPLGTNVSITATPSNHYHFVSWSGDTNGCMMVNNVITATMSRPRVITANFAIDREVLVVSTARGKASPAAGTNAYNYGTSLRASITNSPVTSGATQYVCSGWTGTGSAPAGGSTTNTGVFALTSYSSIVWTWRTNYYLRPLSGVGGRVNVAAGWRSMNANVLVTATASNGYAFVSWSGDIAGCTVVSNTITAMMSGARTIQANFAVSAQGVEATAGPSDDTLPPQVVPIRIRTDPASPGYLVISWSSEVDTCYSVSKCTNLMFEAEGFVLMPDAEDIPGSPPENTWICPIDGEGPVFYRVEGHR